MITRGAPSGLRGNPPATDRAGRARAGAGGARNGADPHAASSSGRLRGSARLRILGWSMLLLAVALGATAAVTHVLLLGQLDRGVRAELTNEINEFQAQLTARRATALHRPGSGQVLSLLLSAANRTVAQPGSVLVGIVDHRIVAISNDTVAASIRGDRVLLTGLAAITRPLSGSATLPSGQLRYAAAPVHIPGDPAHGVFVAATLMTSQQQSVNNATQLQLEVGAAALAIGSALAWIASGRVLRPIRDVTDLARRISETDLSARIPVRGHDDVSELSVTINGMLDRLESTFMAQRRFLADAGHELRTPITIVQGNLDTLQPADPDEAETLAIVSDELTRMSRLTGELLLLAGSGRPGFLHLQPVDLAALTTALAAKARGLSERRWLLTGTAEGRALLDGHRITQAVMQLAANAAVHTPDHVTVELASAIEQDHVVFSVADHGAGIPAADRERIFQRFARLDQRRTDGTGLGLSIVAAIAAAHGGSVTAGDTPGGGALFRVVVPYHAVPADPAQPSQHESGAATCNES